MSNNPCTYILENGKHKGERCGSINRYCRHQCVTCERCGKTYKRLDTYRIHPCTAKEEPTPTQTVEPPRARVRIEAHKKPDITSVLGEFTARLEARLEAKIEARFDLEARLEARFDALEAIIVDKPSGNIIQNNTTYNNNYIMVGDNFYSELVGKMGKDAAVQYLVSVATNNNPLDIVRTLYLNGDPRSHSITCRDQNHFRYMGAENKVVDDKGGYSIGCKVSNSIQNAMLMASNELIAQQLGKETEMSDDEMERFYQVQMCATNTIPCKTVTDELSKMTINADHPFWSGKWVDASD